VLRPLGRGNAERGQRDGLGVVALREVDAHAGAGGEGVARGAGVEGRDLELRGERVEARGLGGLAGGVEAEEHLRHRGDGACGRRARAGDAEGFRLRALHHQRAQLALE